MERFNRAVRRHHVARLKSKRRVYYGWNRKEVDHMHGIILHDCIPPRILGIAVHTPQRCSCAACGNVRRWPWMNYESLTIQERRWIEQYKEQLTEID